MSGRPELAPDRMTDAQLWKFVTARMFTARMMCTESGRRTDVAATLSQIDHALGEIERRGKQGQLQFLDAPESSPKPVSGL